MRTQIVRILLVSLTVLSLGSTVQFILRPNLPTCSVLISTFDPIKVEAIFPTIGSKQQGQKFKISLSNDKTGEIQQTIYSQDNRTFRNNFILEPNVLYSLCFELVSNKQSDPSNVLFVGFTAEEHFQDKIGKIDIPKELANEENLKFIYETATRMTDMNIHTINYQKRQRQLEDKLVNLSLHKGQRIINITLFECFVIIVSGVYQIFALRKFLIDKNLY